MNTGSRNKKSPEQITREYEKATDPGLVRFIESVRSVSKDEANRFGYRVSEIGERQRADAERLIGEKINARSNFIGGSEIHHIDYRHGENGAADHSMANTEDMARIGYVLENYDNVDLLTDENGTIKTSGAYTAKDGRPSPIIIYVKKVNGFHSVVEAVNDGKRGRLNIISSYKSNADPIEINKAQMPRAAANKPAAP